MSDTTPQVRYNDEIYASGGVASVAGVALNAQKVNNHTVNSDVPANSVFMDHLATQEADWDTYKDLPASTKNNGTMYIIPDSPSGIALVPKQATPGAVVTFDDGIVADLYSMTIAINPVQAGSGDPSPSNPRTISGWTGANICNIADLTKVGYFKGLISGTHAFVDMSDLSWSYQPANSRWVSSGISSNIKKNQTIIPAISTQYEAVQYDSTIPSGTMAYYATNGNFFVNNGSTESEPTGILIYELVTPTTPTITPTQLRTILTAFGGYAVPVSWQTEAGTVYGGELDVTSGVLTVTQIGYDMKLLNWTYVIPHFQAPTSYNNVGYNGNNLCSIYKKSSINNVSSTQDDESYVVRTDMIYIRNNSFSGDVTNFVNAMDGQKIICELLTPQTYQLTPTQVSSILGTNNIWVDTGDILELTYQVYGNGTVPELRYKDTIYGGGSKVIPNPEDASPTNSLKTVYINGVTYDFEGTETQEDILYEPDTTSFADITVDWDWSDYDLYVFRVHNTATSSQDGDTSVLTKGQINDLITNSISQYFYRSMSTSGFAQYTFTSSQITAVDNSNGLLIQQIVGVKCGNIPSIQAADVTYNNSSSRLSAANVQEAIDAVNNKLPIVYGEASGAIATFSDGAANPLEELDIGIEPVQAGTGDPSPSNPRAISGWTGANVYRTGANVFDSTQRTANAFIKSDGTEQSNTSWTISNYMEVSDSFLYTGISNAGESPYSAWYDANKTLISTFKQETGTKLISVPNNAKYVRISMLNIDVSNFSGYTNGSIVQISWQTEAGTVYGGRLNVLSGELTNTNRLIKLSELTWQNWGSGGRFFASISLNRAKGSSGNNACECYKKEPNDSTSATMIDKTYVIRETAIYIKDSDYDNDLQGFINSLGDNEITYELLTPSTTYQLSQNQVSSIPGTNNIWVDTGKVINCKYIRDLNSTINILWNAVFNS